MKRVAFNERDLAVYEAHSVTEVAGRATTSELRRCHPGPLPVQRLSGMARRGLLYRGFATWQLTAHGLSLAEQFRAAKSAGEGEQS